MNEPLPSLPEDARRVALELLLEYRERSARISTATEQPDDCARCVFIMHTLKNEFTVTELRIECSKAGISIPYRVPGLQAEPVV